MKVAYVSTFKTKCGIATYTENLLREFNKSEGARGEVLAQVSDDLNIEYSNTARFCWTRGSNNLIDAIRDCTIDRDILHFQHEFGIFTNNKFLFDAITTGQKNGCKVVVTLHTVPPFGSIQNTNFVIDLCRVVDAVIVHTEEGFASVATAAKRAAENDNETLAGKVFQVPHGSPLVKIGDKARGLEILGLTDEICGYLNSVTVGGAVGFIGPGKFLESTLEAYMKATAYGLINTRDNAFLIIGAPPDPTSKYPIWLSDRIAQSGLTNIFLVPSFIKRENLSDVLDILDYAVLNTQSESLSASGQVHEHIARGIPLAVRNAPIDSAAIRAGAIPYSLKPDESCSDSFMTAIVALATSKRVRASIGQRVLLFAKRTTWDKIANTHLKLYQKLLEG